MERETLKKFKEVLLQIVAKRGIFVSKHQYSEMHSVGREISGKSEQEKAAYWRNLDVSQAEPEFDGAYYGLASHLCEVEKVYPDTVFEYSRDSFEGTFVQGSTQSGIGVHADCACGAYKSAFLLYEDDLSSMVHMVTNT